MTLIDQVVKDSPESYWPMDEMTGTLRDLSGAVSHLATVNNGVIL